MSHSENLLPWIEPSCPLIEIMKQGVWWTMTQMRKLEEQVGAWPHVSVHPHRFGGREFRIGNAELGHLHIGGTVDIPFPRAVRDALLADGLAEEHRWVSNSGWTAFHVRSEGDLQHALWLMRLSYLRYALKTASDPGAMLEQESDGLGLSTHLRSLLQQHLPTKELATADPLTA
jgi:hypothetical protein